MAQNFTRHCNTLLHTYLKWISGISIVFSLLIQIRIKLGRRQKRLKFLSGCKKGPLSHLKVGWDWRAWFLFNVSDGEQVSKIFCSVVFNHHYIHWYLVATYTYILQLDCQSVTHGDYVILLSPRSDFNSETSFGILSPNYTCRCTWFCCKT